jgi:solute carrier family 25 citrate transporter 1
MSTPSTVTPLEHTAIGALGGTVEVCIMQPLVGIKNALQEGRPIPKNPAHLYRGLLMNIVSMAPITASQFGTNRLMQTVVLEKSENDLTGVERFGSAAVAGAVSAFIASPSELIIIQQQVSGVGGVCAMRIGGVHTWARDRDRYVVH